jgi:predicted transposase YdaD
MRGTLEGHSLSFRHRVVDIRDLKAAPLLASDNVDENVIAVLMQLGDERADVRRILERVSQCEPGARERALKELGILAGLRGLGEIIKKETKTMPILDDIMDHDLLGPILRRGLEQGRVEGRVEGRMEGEQTVVIRQIEKRFGSIPPWARQRVEAMPAPEVEETALRLLDARSLEELFGS